MPRRSATSDIVGAIPEWMKPEFHTLPLETRTEKLIHAFVDREYEQVNTDLAREMSHTLSEWLRR